ncbi:MAG: hypothetical protein ACSHX6_05500 [Akkermansiaceae bacterium]
MLKRFFTSICIISGALFGTIGCSTENQNLYVDKFTLRSIKIEDNDAAMVRGDQQKRLYGAVSIKEHQQRIGQYYRIRWNLLDQPEITDWNRQAQLVFRYKQASTGSKIITAAKTYPIGTKQGKWAFNNIGKDYSIGGRILAWRTDLIYGGQIISTKESYLWNN